MASLDLTDFAPALKELYPKGLSEILYKKCPLWGWLPKKKDFFGSQWDLAPFIGGTMGSNSFDVALGNKTNVTTKKFAITRAKTFAVASVDAETMAATANDRGAFAKALQTQTRGALYTVTRAMAHQIYGNGGGARGRGDAAFAIGGTTITLADARDAVHFEIGLVLQSASTDGTSGAVNAGEVTVTAVDTDAGDIEVDAVLNVAIPAIANNDYFFRKGDFGNSITGLLGWLPTTTPTAGDSHFGVDRSVHPTRLAGVRYNAGGKLIEEAVFLATSKQATMGGGEGECALFMNNEKYTELLNSMHSKTYIDIKTEVPGIGYKALQFAGSNGTIPVISDPNCPYDYGFLLERATWEFKSLGECPHFAQDDGKKYTREALSDGIEFRVRSWHNMGCEMPGHNVVITW